MVTLEIKRLAAIAATKMNLDLSTIEELISEDLNVFIHCEGKLLQDYSIDLFIQNTPHCSTCGSYKVEIHNMTMSEEFDSGTEVMVCECGKSSSFGG